MAGAGNIILFVVSLAGCAIWSAIYLIFAGHYFLVTLIDSSAGNDEINFDTEPFLDRWWKPLFCLWVLVFWVLTGCILLSPCLARQSDVLLTLLALLVWFAYPLGLISALSGSHWFYVVNPPVIARLLGRYGAFAYVNLLTLLGVSAVSAFLFGVFRHSLLWALPASFVLPTVLLLYARLWGRYAWMALNFTPKKKKKWKPAEPGVENEPNEEMVPEMDVMEVDAMAEGIREGLPPAAPHTYQDGSPTSITANAMIPLAGAEEEDEWAKDKKPYGMVEEAPPPILPAYALDMVADADKPISLVQHYDEENAREKERQEKAKAPAQFLPQKKRKKPTFQTALVQGVAEFMIYGRTLQAWANLVVLTIVELFFLYMVMRFWPALD